LPSVACLARSLFFAYALSPTAKTGGRGVEQLRMTDMLENGSDGVRAVAWSFDGKMLASGGNDKRIILWDAKRGERLTELKGNR